MTTNSIEYNRQWLNSKFTELRARFGNKCFFCNATTGLEFAHKRPTALSGRGRGKINRYYDIIKNSDAYLLTCKAHNSKAEGLL